MLCVIMTSVKKKLFVPQRHNMNIQISLAVYVPNFWRNEIREVYIMYFRLFEFPVMST